MCGEEPPSCPKLARSRVSQCDTHHMPHLIRLELDPNLVLCLYRPPPCTVRGVEGRYQCDKLSPVGTGVTLPQMELLYHCGGSLMSHRGRLPVFTSLACRDWGNPSSTPP